MNENFEVNASPCHSDPTVDYFDRIIGLIEDIVISAEFQVISNSYLKNIAFQIHRDICSQQRQNEFLDKNYERFTEDEENQICYMDIFNEYTATIETFIMDHLKASVCDVEMNRFLAELR